MPKHFNIEIRDDHTYFQVNNLIKGANNMVRNKISAITFLLLSTSLGAAGDNPMTVGELLKVLIPGDQMVVSNTQVDIRGTVFTFVGEGDASMSFNGVDWEQGVPFSTLHARSAAFANKLGNLKQSGNGIGVADNGMCYSIAIPVEGNLHTTPAALKRGPQAFYPNLKFTFHLAKGSPSGCNWADLDKESQGKIVYGFAQANPPMNSADNTQKVKDYVSKLTDTGKNQKDDVRQQQERAEQEAANEAAKTVDDIMNHIKDSLQQAKSIFETGKSKVSRNDRSQSFEAAKDILNKLTGSSLLSLRKAFDDIRNNYQSYSNPYARGYNPKFAAMWEPVHNKIVTYASFESDSRQNIAKLLQMIASTPLDVPSSSGANAAGAGSKPGAAAGGASFAHKAQEEAARKAQEEAYRRAQEAAARKAKEEAARKAQEDTNSSGPKVGDKNARGETWNGSRWVRR